MHFSNVPIACFNLQQLLLQMELKYLQLMNIVATIIKLSSWLVFFHYYFL